MMWYERPENAGKVERLKKMYKSIKNDEIMLKLDISFSALHRAGVCSEERSMISPDYARNFICDFILGKEQKGTQLNLFGNGHD